jgi:hypothetical protein
MRNATILLILASTLSVMAQSPIRLRKGEYLRVDYLEILKKQRSTFLAGGKDGVGGTLSARIEFKGNDQSISFSDNFHETDMDRIVDLQSNALRVDDPKIDPLRLKMLSENEFEIVEPKSRLAKFRFVDSIDQTAISHTIAGKYVDSAGALYEFSSNGTAIFPDRTVHFEIGLDHVMDRFDYIIFKGESWAFQFKNKKLMFFKFINDEMAEPLPNPFLILTAKTQ